MGVLDDAIREHLELKRKHGAAEEDLRRQEDEALGPARREVGQAGDELAPSSFGDGDVEEGEVAGEPPAPFGVGEETEEREKPLPVAGEADELEREGDEAVLMAEEPEELEREGEGSPPRAEEPEETEAEDRYPQLEPKADHPPEEPVFDPEPEPEEPGVRDTAPGGSTAAEDEEEEDEGDVLEDTPDFLQETPEHDRLWFEQKPPRDFDFD